jgi:hypothetical protein
MGNPCDGYNYNGKFFADKKSFMDYLNGEGRKALEEDVKRLNEELPKKTQSVGVSHKALTSSAEEIGIEGPKRGKGSTRLERERKANELSGNLDEANRLVNDFLENKKKLISEGREDEIAASPKQVAAGKAILGDLNKQRDEARDAGDVARVQEINKKIFEQHKISKEIATASHMTFAEHQGDIDLNTDSESAMESAAEAKSKTQLTEKQREEVREKARKSKKTKEVESKILEEIDEAHKGSKKADIDVTSYFSDKKDNKFTTEEAKAIWEHAKENYIDKGIGFEEMVKSVSTDTGLSVKQVIEAIATPKSARKLTQKALIAQSNRRKAIANAKAIVANAGKNRFLKVLNKTNTFFTAVATFAHGTVGPFTHAAGYFKTPSQYAKLFKFIKQTYKYSYGGLNEKVRAEYETMVLDLKSHERYNMWEKLGLAVNPDEFYDETEGANAFFNAASGIGERGFNCLKPFRLAVAEGYYEKLTPEQRENPEFLKNIVDLVNHSTGSYKGLKMNEVASTAFFAPSLKLAKAFDSFVDPTVQAFKMPIYSRLSEAEKHKARITLKRAGERIGVSIAFLAINQFILSASGSKKKVNIFNPHDPDWLKFKVGDVDVDTEGGSMWATKTVFALAYNAKMAAVGGKDKYGNYKTPDQKDAETLGQQIRFSLSPGAGIVWDLVTGKTAMGRPLPFYKGQKATKKHPRYTPLEYLGSKGPIPLAEGLDVFVEGMRESGMKDPEIVDYLNNSLEAVGVAAAAGVIGIKVKPSKEKKEGKPMSFQQMYDQLNKSSSSNGNVQKMYDQLNSIK